MNQKASPKITYKLGGSLSWNHPTYIKRKADDQLYEQLKQGNFCYVFNARQMGKSSLQNQVKYRLEQDGIKCSALDLTGMGGESTTQEQWYKTFIDELVADFSLTIDLKEWWERNSDLSMIRRLNLFLRNYLLAVHPGNIVIFIDEIDNILSLNFSTDDFFAFIRYWYNKRSTDPVYNRLTFALLGVATPSNLILDKTKTPFNIGKAIELTGFDVNQARLVLAQGIVHQVDNPDMVLKKIWLWTRGQPFLMQKLCDLIVANAETRNPDISDLIRRYIINNWERQDEPQHLRTIRDRLLRDDSKAGYLLALYQQLLEQGSIKTDGSIEQAELILSVKTLIEKKSKIQAASMNCIMHACNCFGQIGQLGIQ